MKNGVAFGVVIVVFALLGMGISAMTQKGNSQKTDQIENDAQHDYGDYDPANEESAPLQLKTFHPPTTAPTTTANTPSTCTPTDIVAVDLVLDTSNSMRRGDRLPQMKSAVKSFAELLKKDDLIGVEHFDAAAKTVFEINHYSENQAGFTSAIDGLTTQRQTHIKDGLNLAHDNIMKARTKFNANYKWIIILLTDGSPVPAATQNPEEAATSLKNDNIRLMTIGLELNKSKADALLGTIASSPQDYYNAVSPQSLQSIYSTISNSLCR